MSLRVQTIKRLNSYMSVAAVWAFRVNKESFRHQVERMLVEVSGTVPISVSQFYNVLDFLGRLRHRMLAPGVTSRPPHGRQNQMFGRQ